MSIHEPGSEPERTDDDTQRLDPVPPLEAAPLASDGVDEVSPAPDDLPTADAQDGGTRVLPSGAEPPQGVDALWDPGAPEGAPSGSAPAPAFATSTPAAPPLVTPSTPAASAPEAVAPEPARSRRRAVRVGTVVWGLVVVACGVLALAAAGGASIDGGTVAIAILGGAGVALVLGSIVTGVRRRDRA